jgi:hypothetical protein
MHCALPHFHVISPSRRDFLARAATLATFFGRPGAASAEGARMRLIRLALAAAQDPGR